MAKFSNLACIPAAASRTGHTSSATSPSPYQIAEKLQNGRYRRVKIGGARTGVERDLGFVPVLDGSPAEEWIITHRENHGYMPITTADGCESAQERTPTPSQFAAISLKTIKNLLP
ncbi:hypothetical protein BD779DRAFT_1674742 [Infundibulicybe gibba]|nr:hypothetical protein BD779DRAFT_1674742 [Infundibulicybe gibba]